MNREPSLQPSRQRRASAAPEHIAGIGSCAGTLGELFQGPLTWRNQLEIAIVSLPFARRSTCRYTLDPSLRDGDALGLEDKPKTARALQMLFALYGCKLSPGRFRFSSDLEVGKGMASSTADIVAAIRCVGAVLQRRFRTHEIMDVLRQVERSDSVFLNQAALYLSERHEIVARFGRWLGFTAAYVVEPAIIDTDAMRDCLREHYARRAGAYRAALDQFLAATARRDPCLVAAAATESAKLSQGCLPKRLVPVLRSALASLRADGIFVAHTGSIAGYLYAEPPCLSLRAEISAFFASLGERVRFDRVGWNDV